MLWNTSTMNGFAIEANDGRIGTVSDFLFEDTSWLIRWLVVDTGKWLPGRKVLLPPGVLGHIDRKREEFSIRLPMSEIENSPEIDADRPVSRQMEDHLYDYYGWNPYWATGPYMSSYVYPDGAIGEPLSREARQREELIANTRRDSDDPHLRSAAAIIGYHIYALDGEIGHVEDFLVEDADWRIHYLLVDTKNWWPGKKVLISPKSATTIDRAHRRVNLNVVRQKVREAPAYDPSDNIDRAYERNFHTYYGGVRTSHPL